MNRRLTPKQERFCLAYVETGNASEAYRQAYPKAVNWKPETVHKRASELLSNRVVVGRAEQLQEAARKRHAVTVDSLTEDARQAIALAMRTEQPSAIVSALQLIAKLHGLGVEKREVLNRLELSEDTAGALEEIARRTDGLD